MSEDLANIQQQLAAQNARLQQLESNAIRNNDLVALKDAPARYGCSEITARRKAKNGFGVKIFGKWFLLNSKVMGK